MRGSAMSSSQPKSVRTFILGALGLAACLILAAASSGGPWPAGQSYQFCLSGAAYWWGRLPPTLRTFGGPATQIGLGTFGTETDYFSDSVDMTGLPGDQVRLVFHVDHEFPGAQSGCLNAGGLSIGNFVSPSGAAFLPDTARVTYKAYDGSQVTLGPTYGGSGIFTAFNGGPDNSILSGSFDMTRALFDAMMGVGPLVGLSGQINGADYEIVVDNVPEPATLGLFASGAVLLTGYMLKNRRKAK